MNIIWLVVQNIDYLKGAYFARAVVIAEDQKKAIDLVAEQLKYYEDVAFDREKTAAIDLGKMDNTPEYYRTKLASVGMNQQGGKFKNILCMEIDEDNDA